MKYDHIKRLRPEQAGKIRTPEQEERLKAMRERRRIKRERQEEEERARRKARRLLFKPCPFCGCNLAEIPYPGDVNVFVQCPSCNATGPSMEAREKLTDRDDEAIKRWNRRATEDKNSLMDKSKYMGTEEITDALTEAGAAHGRLQRAIEDYLIPVDERRRLATGGQVVKLTQQQADEIESEMRLLESNPSTTIVQMRLFMQSVMPCGHAIGNLLTCSEPPFGCVICNGREKD